MIEISESPGIAHISIEDLALVLRQLEANAESESTRSSTATMCVRRKSIFDTIGGLAGPPRLPDGIEVAFASLIRALDAEIVEDGEPHPVEDAIGGFVREFGARYLCEALFAAAFRPTRTASFLRLLGRIQIVPSRDRGRLVERGLASTRVEVRDAAIQAVESWHDPALVDLLMSHRDSEAWLADYAKAVAQDLTE